MHARFCIGVDRARTCLTRARTAGPCIVTTCTRVQALLYLSLLCRSYLHGLMNFIHNYRWPVARSTAKACPSLWQYYTHAETIWLPRFATWKTNEVNIVPSLSSDFGLGSLARIQAFESCRFSSVARFTQVHPSYVALRCTGGFENIART